MRVPLPASVKKRLRATQQWIPIALPPQEAIAEVKLRSAGTEINVTDNNAVAALRPLMIRIGLDERLQAALAPGRSQLRLLDRNLGRVLGLLELNYVKTWRAAGASIGLFQVRSATHYCARWPRRTWDTLMYRRAARRIPAEKQLMSPAGVEQLLTFYLAPRPVFLVGVNDGWHSNLFPMDLVGPLPAERFTLALRNTSVSVETIKNDRRLALSDVPASACPIAYRLGAHHKNPNIDWQGLPFKLLQSELFRLPVPEIALRVREIEILDFETVGSHTLFLGRICSEHALAAGDQLHHTSGVHQRLRFRHRRPFEEAPTVAAV